MSLVIENLRRDARMRLESDREMSPAWITVPLLEVATVVIVIVAVVVFIFGNLATVGPSGTVPTDFFVAFAGLLGILIIGGIALFILGILFAYMLYRLIKRRNTHFARQQFLYDDLIGLVKEAATKKGVDVSLPVNNLDRVTREARLEETEKNAVLWVILIFATSALSSFTSGFLSIVSIIATLYVLYFLMNDFYKHERREDLFLDDLNRALAATGVSVNLPRRNVPIPDRSFILYLILSIVTLGVFSIYWLYVLLTDPNNHFRQQALVEDTILAQATPVV